MANEKCAQRQQKSSTQFIHLEREKRVTNCTDICNKDATALKHRRKQLNEDKKHQNKTNTQMCNDKRKTIAYKIMAIDSMKKKKTQ